MKSMIASTALALLTGTTAFAQTAQKEQKKGTEQVMYS